MSKTVKERIADWSIITTKNGAGYWVDPDDEMVCQTEYVMARRFGNTAQAMDAALATAEGLERVRRRPIKPHASGVIMPPEFCHRVAAMLERTPIKSSTPQKAAAEVKKLFKVAARQELFKGRDEPIPDHINDANAALVDKGSRLNRNYGEFIKCLERSDKRLADMVKRANGA